jgi:hypothetical protein
MIQYRSALLVNAQPGLQLCFSTSKIQPSLECPATHFVSFDAYATAAVAMFGRAWIHFSKRPNP